MESFPVYTSHYLRTDNPDRRFLSPQLSICKMYHLYREMCAEQEVQQVSEWVYRREFNEHFNLSFGRCVCMQLHIHTHHQQNACVFVHCMYKTVFSSLLLSLPPSLPPSPSLSNSRSLSLTHPPSLRPKSDTCKTCDAMKTRLDYETNTDTAQCL